MNREPLAQNRRVLIVDDNPSIHADFRKILAAPLETSEELEKSEAELFGRVASTPVNRPVFEVTAAMQGEEAMALVQASVDRQSTFALAFVDIRMPPGIDGVETTSRLWKIDPDLQVVICTAYSDYSWEDMLARLGHSDRLVILKKPFDPVEVLQLASALTEKWQLLQGTKQRMQDLQVLVTQRTSHLEEANQKLNSEVLRRVRREQCLSLQNEVTRVLADAGAAVDKIAYEILRIISDRLGFDMGRLWLVDSQANLLRCAGFRVREEPGSSSSSGSIPSWPTTAPMGSGLAGHVWKTAEPIWVRDQSSQMGELASKSEEAAGYTSGFAFPLRLEGRVVGVLEFRGRDFHDEDGAMLQGLETTGSIIAHALERRRLEDQLRHSQKIDAVGHLAGGIAHDFNNILTVIQGYAELLKQNFQLPADVADIVRQIAMASERASMLTRQLLTFSRKQIMQPRHLDLNKVIAQTQCMLKRVIREDICLKFEPCREPALVHADEGMLSQVLVNLTCNARDAMPKGGPLTIRTELVRMDEFASRRSADARAGDFVRLSVKDAGSGIRPEDLPHIFEPFFTTKDVGRGTGLGLCTVYGIVKQHKGWVEVSTAVGTGSTFDIFLPRSHEWLKEEPPPEDAPAASLSRTHTILLVEDEDPVRSLASHVLRTNGFQVIEASSGVEALAIWNQRNSEIDMLLSDVVMPDGLSGGDLAARLRDARSGLPVLLVSGYSPHDILGENALEKMNFLPKPYSPQKLIRAVRDCIEGASSTLQSKN